MAGPADWATEEKRRKEMLMNSLSQKLSSVNISVTIKESEINQVTINLSIYPSTYIHNMVYNIVCMLSSLVMSDSL